MTALVPSQRTPMFSDCGAKRRAGGYGKYRDIADEARQAFSVPEKQPTRRNGLSCEARQCVSSTRCGRRIGSSELGAVLVLWH